MKPGCVCVYVYGGGVYHACERNVNNLLSEDAMQ